MDFESFMIIDGEKGVIDGSAVWPSSVNKQFWASNIRSQAHVNDSPGQQS